jgi:hypothetical protein
MRIARRLLGDGAEGDRFVVPVGMSDANGGAAWIGLITIDALVCYIQPIAVAVEQLPQPRGHKLAECVRVACVVGKQRHAS